MRRKHDHPRRVEQLQHDDDDDDRLAGDDRDDDDLPLREDRFGGS
jgi:hypothetical protein